MTNLSNVGYNWKFTPEEIRRFLFCLTLKDDASANSVTLANAALLNAWQTLFNTYNFADDTSIKVVCSPIVYGVTPERGEDKVFDENNYFRKLADGDYDVSAMLYDLAPKQVAGLKALQDYSISVYLITAATQVLGASDGTNLTPFKIQNLTVQDYGITSSEGVSQVILKFRLKNPNELNDMVAITVADADATSDVDFFPLRNVTGAVASPAVTGCTVGLTLDNVDPNNPATAIYMTGDHVTYDLVTFTDQTDDSDEVLAAAGSISYSAATHLHTINEAALLTTGHTYTLKIAVSGYDITCGDVVVP